MRGQSWELSAVPGYRWEAYCLALQLEHQLHIRSGHRPSSAGAHQDASAGDQLPGEHHSCKLPALSILLILTVLDPPAD